MASRRNICDVHDEITEVAKEMVQEAAGIETVGRLRRNIGKFSRRLERLASEAKDYGVHMENRLYDYRHAIENLGFERQEGVPAKE
jgi:phage host-nuclease inhibitor protein Gam